MNDPDVKKRDSRVQVIRSHGRRIDWHKEIADEISTRSQFDAIDKAHLADRISSAYEIPIGKVNRAIDRARRFYGL